MTCAALALVSGGFVWRRLLKPQAVCPMLRPAMAKESAELSRTRLRQHAAGEYNSVVHPRMAEHIQQRSRRAGFFVMRAKDQTADAGVDHRPRAHHARFQRHVHRRVQQPLITHPPPPLAQRHDFSVGGRIMMTDGTVPALADNLVVQHQYRADRHFALGLRAPRQHQGVTHPKFIAAMLAPPADNRGGLYRPGRGLGRGAQSSRLS